MGAAEVATLSPLGLDFRCDSCRDFRRSHKVPALGRGDAYAFDGLASEQKPEYRCSVGLFCPVPD